MGSKSALGHQNDIEKGEKRAEGVLGASWERLGATREAHWGPRTAFLGAFLGSSLGVWEVVVVVDNFSPIRLAFGVLTCLGE